MLLSRKKAIITLAESIADDFTKGNQTALVDIAISEGVRFYFDDYEDAFDGMLVYDESDFHIHINRELGNTEGSKRGRFTFAHELGHFFLDEHRLGLKYGLLEPHPSFHEPREKPLMEIEADYFAGCLLMPTLRFRNRAGGKKFSFQTILDLSDIFQASIPSTIIRFTEVGTHEIFAVFSRNNIIQWSIKSYDFPNWRVHGGRGQTLPRNTVAGDYFTQYGEKLTGIEKVSAFDWFNISRDDNRASRTMYEQCHYSKFNDQVISILWFD